MENNFVNRGVDVVTKAIKADEEERYKEAVRLYKNAAELFVMAIKFEQNPETVKQIHSRLTGYVIRAEELQTALDNGGGDGNNNQGSINNGPSGGTVARKKNDPPPKDENSQMKGQVGDTILAVKPNVKWTDVAGLEQAKESLREAVILPARFPHLFVGNREPWKGILLYGPPGTGKSYLAAALATEADSNFFSISSSDIVSKWQGESEKMVKTLFEVAREKQPSILFIDEIDSLCSTRSEGENESSRRIKTEFLVQMDGVGSNQTGVLILGATNKPWEIDQAMRRRLEKRVYIPLPEKQARGDIFRIRLGDKDPHSLRDEDFYTLGELSEGYSGSDIKTVVKGAVMEPLRTMRNARQFYEDNDGKLYPCTEYPACPDCPMELSDKPLPKFAKCSKCHSVRMTLYEIDSPEKVVVPIISLEDFKKALNKQHGSVGADELAEYVSWTKQYGEDG